MAQEAGPAPAGSVAERREWGQNRLGGFFDRAEKWVRRSKQINDDIGHVTSVAPIGTPNSYGESFGEAWASLNLQVIGVDGEGVLLLPRGEPDEKAVWVFGGLASPVSENGKSWLGQNDLEKEYSLVLEMAEQEDHAGVISACEQLKHQADRKGQTPVSLSTDAPILFAGLPIAFRTQVLKALATSLIATDDLPNDMGVEALDVCVEASEVILNHILEQPPGHKFPTNPVRAADDLQQANEFLSMAIQLAPESRYIKDLASIRALMAYRLQAGCSLREDRSLSESERQNCQQEMLQSMYSYAKNLAEQSSYLQRELGEMQIQPYDGYTGWLKERERDWSALPSYLRKNVSGITNKYGDLSLSQDARFGSYIGLDVAGENGTTGTLFLFVEERADQAHQRDLFSKEVAGPSGKYQHFKVSWHESGGRSKNLSSETLNPARNKTKKQQTLRDSHEYRLAQ
ncbi:hypothetical protein N9Y42_02785 [Mariniblastus sp.]|nr:hypothetical protein [Mariniblastus sp.]